MVYEKKKKKNSLYVHGKVENEYQLAPVYLMIV